MFVLRFFDTPHELDILDKIKQFKRDCIQIYCTVDPGPGACDAISRYFK